MKRLVAVDRSIMAGISSHNKSPQNLNYLEKPRKKFADMESMQSDTQTTFLKGSGGVRIEDRTRNTEAKFTFQDKNQTPKVLAHIKD